MNKKSKKRTPRSIKCEYTSMWDCDVKVTTEATYYPKTGEVDAETSKVEVDGMLLDEYVTLPDDTEIPVCRYCHDHVKRTEMNPGIGHDLNEELVCTNPDCESNY